MGGEAVIRFEFCAEGGETSEPPSASPHLPAVLPQHHVQRLGVLRPGGCTDLVVQRAAPRALQVAADQCLAAEVDLRLSAAHPHATDRHLYQMLAAEAHNASYAYAR